MHANNWFEPYRSAELHNLGVVVLKPKQTDIFLYNEYKFNEGFFFQYSYAYLHN